MTSCLQVRCIRGAQPMRTLVFALSAPSCAVSASSRSEILFLRNKPNRCAAAAKTINGSPRIEEAQLKWSSPTHAVSKPSSSRTSICARLSPSSAGTRCSRSQTATGRCAEAHLFFLAAYSRDAPHIMPASEQQPADARRTSAGSRILCGSSG